MTLGGGGGGGGELIVVLECDSGVWYCSGDWGSASVWCVVVRDMWDFFVWHSVTGVVCVFVVLCSVVCCIIFGVWW